MTGYQAQIDGLIKVKADSKEEAKKKINQELERLIKTSNYSVELNIKKKGR